MCIRDRPDIELLKARLLPTEPQLQQSAATAIIRMTGADPQVLAMQDISLAESALQGGGGLLAEEALAILGEIGSSKQVGTLARVLRDSTDVATRRGAARALSRVRDRSALVALRSGLEDKEQAVREDVIRALGEAGRRLIGQGQQDVLRDVKGWLGQIVAGPAGREQTLARTTLLKLGDESQRGEVLTALRAGDTEVRRQVIDALDRDSATLTAALEDGEQSNRFLAARRLAELNDKRAIPELQRMLSEKPDSPEGILAYALLRRLNVAAEAPENAKALLDSSEPAVRAAAVQAAAAQDATTAVLVIEKAARDSDKQVRLVAVAESARLPEGDARLSLIHIYATPMSGSTPRSSFAKNVLRIDGLLVVDGCGWLSLLGVSEKAKPGTVRVKPCGAVPRVAFRRCDRCLLYTSRCV